MVADKPGAARAGLSAHRKSHPSRCLSDTARGSVPTLLVRRRYGGRIWEVNRNLLPSSSTRRSLTRIFNVPTPLTCLSVAHHQAPPVLVNRCRRRLRSRRPAAACAAHRPGVQLAALRTREKGARTRLLVISLETRATPPKSGGSCDPDSGTEYHTAIRPHGVALVLIYPCGKAQKQPRRSGAESTETDL